MSNHFAEAMVDVLLRLPAHAPPPKEIIVQGLGILEQAAKTRDINAAWDSAKRQVSRHHPKQFCLDGKVLRVTAAVADRPREKLSAARHFRTSRFTRSTVTPMHTTP